MTQSNQGGFNKSRFVAALAVISCFLWPVSMIAADDDCTPDWGAWTLNTAPTLTATCPAVAGQCVSVAAAAGSYGGPVSASVTVTKTDGAKIQYENNECDA